MFGKFFVPSNAFKVLVVDEDVMYRNFIGWINREDAIVLITEHGFMVGFRYLSFYSDEIVATELSWWVDPEFTGQGIGKALKARFEEWAKNSGCGVIHMGVGKAFDTAEHTRTYLLGLGYTETETSYMKRI